MFCMLLAIAVLDMIHRPVFYFKTRHYGDWSLSPNHCFKQKTGRQVTSRIVVAISIYCHHKSTDRICCVLRTVATVSIWREPSSGSSVATDVLPEERQAVTASVCGSLREAPQQSCIPGIAGGPQRNAWSRRASQTALTGHRINNLQ
jgi:hypothetical protein